MACNCSKNRTAGASATAVSGTYRVMVGTRQVYESTSEQAAKDVASKFEAAQILYPGQ